MNEPYELDEEQLTTSRLSGENFNLKIEIAALKESEAELVSISVEQCREIAALKMELESAYDWKVENAMAYNKLKAKLVRTINIISEFVDDDDTPDANCSCHIIPPCSDCVNHSYRRDLISRAKTLRKIEQ